MAMAGKAGLQLNSHTVSISAKKTERQEGDTRRRHGDVPRVKRGTDQRINGETDQRKTILDVDL